MRLINCPQCGTRCSDQQKKCPECGFELNTFFKNQKEPNRKSINRKTAIHTGIICTIIIALIYVFSRTENHTNSNPNSVEDSSIVTHNEPQPLVIIDSGYSAYNNNGTRFFTYAFKLHNPNTDYNINYPEVSISLRDKTGQLIDAKNLVLSGIAAGDTIWYGNYFQLNTAYPYQVEFFVDYPDYGIIPIEEGDYIRTDDLEIISVSTISDKYDTRYIGEIKNNSNIDLDRSDISIIFFKDNKPIAATYAYTSQLHPGASSSFKTMPFNYTDFDNFEAFAHK